MTFTRRYLLDTKRKCVTNVYSSAKKREDKTFLYIIGIRRISNSTQIEIFDRSTQVIIILMSSIEYQ